MSSPVVGSARIEFTGDMSEFAQQANEEIKSAFSNLQDVIDNEFTKIVQTFGTSGQDAGTAFSDSATASITDGTTSDAVSQAANDADTAAGDWSKVGDTAAGSFGDAATQGIADAGTDQAVIDGADAASSSAGDAWGQVGSDAAQSFTDDASAGISDGADAISNAVADAADASGAADAFGSVGDDAAGSFSDSLSGGVNDGGVLTAIPRAIDQGKPLAIAASTSLGVESGEAAGRSLKAEGAKAGLGFAASIRESMSAVSGTLFAGLGIFGGAEIIKGSIEAADAAQNATLKTKNVFQESATEINEWADRSVKSMRETSDEIKLTADSFGQYLHSIGMTGPKSAEAAETLTTLTANVAAFNNVSQETVQAQFQAALKGRVAGLKQFGIGIDNAFIAQEALRHSDELGQITMKKGVPVLTASQKAQAIYYALLDKSAGQQHALADSAGTARAKQAELNAEVGELETKLGNTLLPILVSVSGFLVHDVVPVFAALGRFVQENSTWLKPLAEGFLILAAGMKVGKIAMSEYSKVMAGSTIIQRGFYSAQITLAKMTDRMGITEGRAATLTEANQRRIQAAKGETTTAEERLGTATSTATTAIVGEGDASATAAGEVGALGTAAGTAAGEIEAEGTAAATASGEMGALAGTTEAAATATAELDAATAAGGAGGIERLAGSAAGAKVAMGGATTAAEGLGAAGAASLGGFVVLAAAAVVGLGLLGTEIGNLTGSNKEWAKVQDKNVKGAKDVFTQIDNMTGHLTEALATTGGALNQTAVEMEAAQAESSGLADKAKDAGISLTDLTTGVVGTNDQFNNLVTTWRASGNPSKQTIFQLREMRTQFQKAQADARALAAKQADLNRTVAAFHSPTPAEIRVHDHAMAVIKADEKALGEIDGRKATVTIDAHGTITSVTYGVGPGQVKMYAGGGSVDDGPFIVGENGPEFGYKSGSNVEIMSNADTMRSLSANASRGSVNTSSGGLTDEDRDLLRAIANRPAVFNVDGRELARASNEGNLRLVRRS